MNLSVVRIFYLRKMKLFALVGHILTGSGAVPTTIALIDGEIKIGLTLEYLETKGVPVVGYGTDKLSAFYTRESVFDVNFRLDTPEDVAAMLHAKWQLDLDGGAVHCQPNFNRRCNGSRIHYKYC